MRRNREDEDKGTVRVELKYCERCGGLWVRECGAGEVYCERCRGPVEDLPIPKRKPAVKLPVKKRATIDKYEFHQDGSLDLEAAGGAA